MTKGSVDEIDKLVSKQLREFRLRKKISQINLGEAIGVSFQQIQKYEKGYNRISASRLYQLAKVLGVTPNDFYLHISTIDE